MAGYKAAGPEEILQELRRIAFARATDYMAVEDGSLVIRSTKELTREQAAAIAMMERTSVGIRVKFYDKLKALELLGKQYGLFEGKAPQKAPDNHLLEAIIAGTKEDMDIGDISEFEQATMFGDDLVEQALPS